MMMTGRARSRKAPSALRRAALTEPTDALVAEPRSGCGRAVAGLFLRGGEP